MPYSKTKLGFLFLLMLLRISSAINGYLELNDTYMAPLNTTKLVLWLRDFIKYLVWILVRRSIL